MSLKPTVILMKAEKKPFSTELCVLPRKNRGAKET